MTELEQGFIAGISIGLMAGGILTFFAIEILIHNCKRFNEIFHSDVFKERS